MTTEERQLSEMLHRVTPEPPRPLTVEDVASRLSDTGGRGAHRRPWSRGWVPLLAGASVVAVAGASAAIAAALSSHHPSPSTGGTQGAAPATSSASASPSASPRPAWPPEPIARGPWGAELINRYALAQDSLASGGKWLYAAVSGDLVRIDPATGNLLGSAAYSPPVPGPPVVVGNTVWVVCSYDSGQVVLCGYDGTSLTHVASVTVPARGQLAAAAQGVLTAGPDGTLYVAAGGAVAVVNPSSRRVVRTIPVSAGQASSVAVHGSRLYVSAFPAAGGTLSLLAYDLASGRQVASSSMPAGAGGNLVATSGGVWGTVGTGMSEWVWFAPAGDLSRSFRVTQGAGAGLESVPALSAGAVWIGGSHTLACADPATGKVLASAAIPTDQSVLEYFGRVTVIGTHAYSDYLDNRAQRAGVARLAPPAACTP